MYTLTPRLSSLGGHAKGREREGALLKVEYDDEAIGYADIHPWVELGDEPLAIQLQKLSNFETTPLTQRSLELATLDAEARRNSVSLFQGLKIPDSHFLVTDLKKGFADEVLRARDDGYTTLKIKVGRSVQSLNEDRAVLEHAMNALEGFKLRFDFNSQRSHEDVQTWVQSLSLGLRSAIEFVEDPCPWNLGNWIQLRERAHVPVAIDHESEDIFSTPAGFNGDPYTQLLACVIVKPAVQDPSTITNETLKYVVTSYLDHPIGQMGAALEAGFLAERAKVETCGLLSHHSYEQNAYSESFPSVGPQFIPPTGDFGIGYGELLEREKWHELHS